MTCERRYGIEVIAVIMCNTWYDEPIFGEFSPSPNDVAYKRYNFHNIGMQLNSAIAICVQLCILCFVSVHGNIYLSALSHAEHIPPVPTNNELSSNFVQDAAKYAVSVINQKEGYKLKPKYELDRVDIDHARVS